MSLSKEKRLENCELALRLMLTELGDEFINMAEFEIAAPIFDNVEVTTWRELQNHYLIRDSSTIGSTRYVLTGEGWRTALELDWDSNEKTLEEKLAKLAAALKEVVKGREADGYADPESLALETGLPPGWISNAIEGRLLDYKFNMKGAEWYEGHRHTIFIPVDFGLEPIDL